MQRRQLLGRHRAGPDAVRRGRQSRCRTVRRSRALADGGGLHGACAVRHHQRGQFARSRRAHGAARGTGRRRHRARQADAGHGHLLARRYHRAHAPRARPGLRRHADAAALLLQGSERGGAVPLLRRGDRGRRRRQAEGLPLPHPAGGPGRLPAAADRPADQGVSQHGRRSQGLLGRLEQHGRDPGSASGFRGVPGLRDLPARRPPQGRRGLHLRHLQRQRRSASAKSTTTGKAPTPTSCRPISPRCARRSRPSR